MDFEKEAKELFALRHVHSVPAVERAIAFSLHRAYAAGQEDMRAQSRSFEPPLTCPHIDRFLSSNAASDEMKEELREIKAINSQLRWTNWHLQIAARESVVNEFTPLATTKDIGLE